jgi:hypothetical protein
MHFGVAPLHSALVAKLEALEGEAHKMCPLDFEVLSVGYHHMMAVQIIRTWFKVGKMFMNYIVTSPEKALGTIERHWWRWEYQDAKGNLPHIHALFWTKENKHDPEQLKKLQERVRCSLATFFTGLEEVKAYVKEGLMSDDKPHTLQERLDAAKLIQTHTCAKAGYRCMRRVGAGGNDLQCRVVDYYVENPSPHKYGYKRINPRHHPEVMTLFQTLEMYNMQGQPLDN